MMGACHTPDSLRAFLAGELAPDAEAALASHVEGCDRCERQIEQLSDDGSARALLVEHRRSAVARDDLPPEVIELRQRLHVLGWCGSEGSDDLAERPTRGAGFDGTRGAAGEATEPQPAPAFGKFRIVRRIGAGGFGVVYLAIDTSLNRQVALKLARTSVLADPDLKSRFLREAEALARLDHPNIVPVYEVGEHEGTCYLAMGYCDGPTLADWLHKERGPAAPRIAVQIALALTEAAEHAHQHAILHRDIKPGNVMLDRPSDRPGDAQRQPADLPFVPKLTDFGVAKMTERTAETTLAGALVGTPQYMAPEQAAGLVERVGPATDVYSLGAVLYEMLTGRPPICGTTTVDTLRRVLIDDPPRPKLVLSVPDDLDAIVMKAIDKSPTRRYATARQLADDLRRYLDGLPTLARPLTRSQRTLLWIRRNPSRSVLAAVAAVVVTVSLGLFVYTQQKFQDMQAESGRKIRALEAQTNRERAAEAYVFGMLRASELTESGNVAHAASELRQLVPREGAEDLRGIEWHYLWALTTREPLADAATPKAGPQPNDAGDVYQICLSPSGREVAAACRDGCLYLYDARHLSQRAKIQIDSEINGVAYSPDGLQIATATDDGQIRLFSARTHEQIGQFAAHAKRAYQVLYLDGGRTLATCGEEPIIRLWDAQSYASLGTLVGHTGDVEAIALSPSGAELASASEDQTAIVWHLATQKPRETLEGHKGKLTCLCFSPDGKWLVTGDHDAEVLLWRIAKGRSRARGRGFDIIQSVCFTRDGRLLVGDRSGSIRSYRLGPEFPESAVENALENPEDRWAAHDGHVWSLALLPTDERFISAGRDGWLRAWSRSGSLLTRWKPNDQDDCFAAEYSRDGSRLLSLRKHQGIEAVHLQTGDGRSMSAPDVVWDSLAVLKGREQVAAATTSGEICLFNWKTGNLLQNWKVTEQAIQRLKYSPQAHLLAVVSHAREDVLLVDPNTGLNVGALPAPSCTSCSFSPDGQRLIVDTLNQLAIFDVRGKSLVKLSAGHRGNINDLAYSPDGQRIATASTDRTVRLWTAEGELLADLGGYSADVMALAFTSDGNSLVTGAVDGRIKIFHVATGRELMDVATGLPGIHQLAVAADNCQIAVVSGDWKLWLIDIPKRDEAN
jgi:serine/threonine protein kinase/WD40 repeat protein